MRTEKTEFPKLSVILNPKNQTDVKKKKIACICVLSVFLVFDVLFLCDRSLIFIESKRRRDVAFRAKRSCVGPHF